MAKRNPIQQTKHDKKVRKIAQQYKNQEFKVKADLPGFERPECIGKYRRRPDVEAVKGRKREIVEVETPETLKTDKDQHATFERHAAHKRNTKFRIEVAK